MENNVNKFEEKFISVLRIYFLTFGMTFFVIAWKVGFNADFIKNWLSTWAIVMLGVFTLMCFIVSPVILDGLKLEGKKRQIVGLLILTFVFAFVFSYRFDFSAGVNVDLNYIKTILINWIFLIVVVFPFGMFIAGPLAKKISGPLAQ